MVIRGRKYVVSPFDKWHTVKSIDSSNPSDIVYITMCGLPIRKNRLGDIAEYPDTEFPRCTIKACGLTSERKV